MITEILLFIIVIGIAPITIFLAECSGLIDDNMIFDLDEEQQIREILENE